MKKIILLTFLLILSINLVSAETIFEIIPTNCADNLCHADINWNHSSRVQLWVEVNQEPFLMFCGHSGEKTINWIAPKKDYVFKMYNASDCTAEGKDEFVKEIADRFIASEGSISMSEKVCGGTLCTATLSWTSDHRTQIWVDDGKGEQVMSCGFSGKKEVPWLQPGKTYTFSQYSALDCQSDKFQLLDELVIEVESTSEPEPTPEPEEPTTNNETPIGTDITNIIPQECNGCLEGTNCLAIGARTLSNNLPVYCDLNKQLTNQKEISQTCMNNYECKSNQCSDGACFNIKQELAETKGILQTIIDWIKEWFGIDLQAELKPKLNSFYRRTQLQGHLVANGLWLYTIPDYLTSSELDFPYPKRNSAQEIPYVDQFSIVRFLGGYPPKWADDSTDFVYKEGNTLKYRCDQIATKLNPYLEQGYELKDIMITLDNIPWAIARNGGNLDAYGQTEPPESWEEWTTTIEEFAKCLKDQYGTDANNLRFKTGTEFNTLKSFTGNQDDFHKYHHLTQTAISKHLPNAEFMPGEIGGDIVLGNINFLTLADYLLTNNLPTSGFARSTHGFLLPGFNLEMNMPARRANNARLTFDRFVEKFPEDNDLTFEIHQFGFLGDGIEERGLDPAGKQASWFFQTMFQIYLSGRTDGIWHWMTFQPFSDKIFILSNGWLLQILDNLQGAEIDELNYELQDYTDSPLREIYGLSFTQPNKVTFIISSFDLNDNFDEVVYAENPCESWKALKGRVKTTITIPKRFQDKQFKYTRMSQADNVHRLVRDDLCSLDLLAQKYMDNPILLDVWHRMAANKHADASSLMPKWTQYENAMKKSLQLKELDLGGITQESNTITTYLEPNEVLVLQSVS